MNDIGLIIKQLRDELRLTQDDLAEQSGVPLSTIRGIEQGTRPNPTVETLNALAKPLGKTYTELNALIEGEVILSDMSEILKLPRRGYITAGIPAPAEAIDLGIAYVRKTDVSGAKKMSGLYCLRISGDSLIGDKINNGDDVVIEPNPDLIEDKIYAVK